MATMALWRVTVMGPVIRGRRWHHVYAVLAADADTAKAKALRKAPVTIASVTAEEDEEGILKGASYRMRG